MKPLHAFAAGTLARNRAEAYKRVEEFDKLVDEINKELYALAPEVLEKEIKRQAPLSGLGSEERREVEISFGPEIEGLETFEKARDLCLVLQKVWRDLVVVEIGNLIVESGPGKVERSVIGFGIRWAHWGSG